MCKHPPVCPNPWRCSTWRKKCRLYWLDFAGSDISSCPTSYQVRASLYFVFNSTQFINKLHVTLSFTAYDGRANRQCFSQVLLHHPNTTARSKYYRDVTLHSGALAVLSSLRHIILMMKSNTYGNFKSKSNVPSLKRYALLQYECETQQKTTACKNENTFLWTLSMLLSSLALTPERASWMMTLPSSNLLCQDCPLPCWTPEMLVLIHQCGWSCQSNSCGLLPTCNCTINYSWQTVFHNFRCWHIKNHHDALDLWSVVNMAQARWQGSQANHCTHSEQFFNIYFDILDI